MASTSVRAGIAVVVLLAGTIPIQVVVAAEKAVGPPTWVMREMDRTEGRWIADNSSYKSDNEPYDAYGMEWTFAPGRKSLQGRLFAMDEGKVLGTLWEYRQFWHPQKKALWLMQFGTDGTVGEGAIESTGPDTTQMEQTFYARSGASWKTGHRSTHQEEKRSTQSFAIDQDGAWKPMRTYVWVKEDQRPQAAEVDRIGYKPAVLFQLAVSDLNRAIAFYTTMLGFELEMYSEELEWARIKPGIPGVTIGLGRQDDVSESSSVSLNLSVSDLDAARAELESRGVRFEGPNLEVPGVVRLADFKDPDGNRIRLAEDISAGG